MHLLHYELVCSELELYEKDTTHDFLSGEDIEATTELLRKMYDADLHLWGLQNAMYITDDQRRRIRDQSEAIWAEVRRIIGDWTHNQASQRWTGGRPNC